MPWQTVFDTIHSMLLGKAFLTARATEWIEYRGDPLPYQMHARAALDGLPCN